MKKLAAFLTSMTVPATTLAFDSPGEVEPIETGELSIDNVVEFIEMLIGWLLLLAGLLAIGFIILGGVLYIVSAGNEKRAATAKKMIWYAIIGLAIVLLSFVIYWFVTGTLGSIFA